MLDNECVETFGKVTLRVRTLCHFIPLKHRDLRAHSPSFTLLNIIATQLFSKLLSAISYSHFRNRSLCFKELSFDFIGACTYTPYKRFPLNGHDVRCSLRVSKFSSNLPSCMFNPFVTFYTGYHRRPCITVARCEALAFYSINLPPYVYHF